MSKKRDLPSWMKGAGKQLQNSTQPGLEQIGATNPQEKETRPTIQERINQSFPELRFEGSLVYSHDEQDCSFLCQEIEGLLPAEGAVYGFDMEWPVSYTRGIESQTALIQICTSPNHCYLFHVSCMKGLPNLLRNLLRNPGIKWAGVGIESDFWKLDRDFDLKVRQLIKHTVIDLSPLANTVLGTRENWSLENLCKYTLKRRIDKTDSIRRGNWSCFPLTEEQKMYAATDALVGLLLYEHLHRIQIEKT